MREKGIDPQRLRMAAICSVCAEPFVKYMREFSAQLKSLGPIAG
jgi:coenzyme F420-reducing hydrogenase delta subunit